ncbi:MAG TPA: hypothetical protein VMF53_00755 [Alphaproteobacteria bacterium]|nr:hypothetical protein [Alphaproteobacteria bacterium]
MLKTGVQDIEALADPRRLRTLFGGRRRISVALYAKIAQAADPERAAELILEHFADARGAYKRTQRHRFDDFDARVLAFVAERFAADAPLTVHDAGVSDARTAAELFEKLAPRYAQLDYYASDYDTELRVLRAGRVHAVLDRGGRVLELGARPFVFHVVARERENFRLYPVNYAVLQYVERCRLPRLLEAERAHRIEAETLTLASPRASALAARDARFHLIAHDLRDPSPLPRPADLVRAMNVLNESYFDRAALASVVGRLFEGLGAGGLLATGSNDGASSPVKGGIYRKGRRGFEVLWRSAEAHYAHDSIAGFAVP